MKIFQVQRRADTDWELFFAEEPILPAVIRLELKEYAELDHHKEGYIAEKLNISVEDEVRFLKLLLEAKNLQIENDKYIVQDLTIHFNGSFKQRQDMKRYWLGQADQTIHCMNSSDDQGFLASIYSPANSDVKDAISKKIYDCFYDISQIPKEQDNTTPEHTLVVNMQVMEPFLTQEQNTPPD